MAICQAKWDSFVDGLNAEVWVGTVESQGGGSLDRRYVYIYIYMYIL